MAWTYDDTKFNDATASPTYPPATVGQLMQVRLLIQDTNTARQLFQDNEIYFTITKQANVFMSAAVLCDSLVAKGGSIESKKVGELAITYNVKFYQSLAGSLRAQGSGHQVPYAGGISVADKIAQQSDTDWVTPAIVRGLDNNPQAPNPGNPPVNSGPGGGGPPNPASSV